MTRRRPGGRGRGPTRRLTEVAEPLPTVAEQFARAYLCPDCYAVTELTETEPNLYRLLVQHDPTCPQWQAMEQSG